MSKITYINIAGKQYPLSFSLMAAKKLAAEFGGLEAAMSKMGDGKEIDENAVDVVTTVLELLISQGCAYKNFFEADLPAPDNAPIIDGKWTPLPREAIEIGIGIMDIEKIFEQIEDCVETGRKKTFDTKEIAKGKNVKARQE